MTDSVLSPSETDLDNVLCDEAINRPSSYYTKLRNADPVYWNERWNGWVVTSYDAVVAAHRQDGKSLSSERFAGPFGKEIYKSVSDYEQLLEFLSKLFGFRDPPDHTRMRCLVGKALTPKSVEILRPRVRELTRELAEVMRGRDRIDFLAEFASALPLIVIAEFIGVPSEARHELHKWSADLAGVLANRAGDVNRLQRGEMAMRNLVEFLYPIIQGRKAHPRDDLLIRMVQAEERGSFLSEEEVIANAVLMVVVGHETTINLLANGIVAFSQFPDQWELLRRHPALLRTAVEEILRYDGPIRAMARWAKEPLELCGRKIAEGDRLLLVEYAANHDPAMFVDPTRSDIERWPNKHLAFGLGPHACIGAPLSPMEAREAFSYLTSEFQQVKVLERDLRYDATIVSRGRTRLDVAFND